jgi:exodeoxyribonuclease VII small subunit
MAKNEAKNDVGKMNFEQAIKELTGIVGKIEQGDIELQDSLKQYERGMALIKHCKDILQKAEQRIEKISEAEPKTQEGPEAKTQQKTEDIPF